MANRGGGLTSTSSITVYPAGSNGNVKPIAAIAGPDTGLDDPCIAVDSSGKIYAGNTTDSITVYPAGSNGNVKPIATIIGPDQGDQTGLFQPNGIALDSKGNIYAANARYPDRAGFKVTVYSAGSNGNVKPIATLGGSATGAQGVAVDSSGKVYVTTQFNADADNDFWGAVTVFSPVGKGELKPIATMRPTANTGLAENGGIAVDSSGKIYVANQLGYGSVTIYAPGSSGDVKPIATIKGGGTGLDSPLDVALDSSRKIYVSRGKGNVTVYPAASDGNIAPIGAFRVGLIKWEEQRFPAGYRFKINGEWHKVEPDGTVVTSNAGLRMRPEATRCQRRS